MPTAIVYIKRYEIEIVITIHTAKHKHKRNMKYG